MTDAARGASHRESSSAAPPVPAMVPLTGPATAVLSSSTVMRATTVISTATAGSFTAAATSPTSTAAGSMW
jgi:hypothetical protein